MCGVWGFIKKFISANPKLKKELEFFFNKISNRGPDYHVMNEVSQDVIFGFHRLAIMDPTSAGNQPFLFEDDDCSMAVVCNGEIYNWEQLRDEYKLDIKSHCDCEIILPLFKKLGADKFFEKLVGVFAMVIYYYDKTTNEWTITFGRDRFGVRPLFIGFNDDDSVGFCSEIKGLTGLFKLIKPFPPGKYASLTKDFIMEEHTYYEILVSPSDLIIDEEYAMEKTKELLTEAVKCRMHADRKICTLLSGGLDSSLVTALLAREVFNEREKNISMYDSKFELHTYSIGMPGAVDHYYANLVAEHIKHKYGKHIDVIHEEIVLSKSDFLSALKNVIYAIESYDVTTVRASTGQYLVSKWIAENTDNKVIFIGDGADEVCVGYLMFGKAPTLDDLQTANEKLVRDIHYFDVLRADRGISENGLEARVPFLDHRFVDFYLSIHPSLKQQTPERMEKYLLRKAFESDDLLPKEVLWRRKEAFSDGVSSQKDSWYKIIQQQVDLKYSDAKLSEMQHLIKHLPPPTKEALYFRSLFKELFGGDWDQYATVIPYYWTPIFEKKDKFGYYEPSARALEHYHKEE